jgi:PAS domain-containing protein
MRIVARPRRDGTLVIWDGIISDITDRKKTEAELAKYRENLEFLVSVRTEELNTTIEELNCTNEALHGSNEELDKYKTHLEEMVEKKTIELTKSHQAMRTVLDNIDFHILVTGFDDDTVLFANKKAIELFGEVIGKKCWKVIQKDMTGPCDFCPKHNLIDEHNQPTGIYRWENNNQINNEWYACCDAAVEWIDGRLVHLEYAINITAQKNTEAELARYGHVKIN